MKYQPPTGGAPNDPYVGANPGAGQQGSRVPPKAIEHPQREIAHVIEAADMVPDEADLHQLLKALQKLIRERQTAFWRGQFIGSIIMPGPTIQTIVTGYNTEVESFFVDPASGYANGKVTIGPADAGIYQVNGMVRASTIPIGKASGVLIYRGTTMMNLDLGSNSNNTAGDVYASAGTVFRVTPGQTVEVRYVCNADGTTNMIQAEMSLVRIGP
jgi:hypothetical protein